MLTEKRESKKKTTKKSAHTILSALAEYDRDASERKRDQKNE